MPAAHWIPAFAGMTNLNQESCRTVSNNYIMPALSADAITIH